MRESANASAEGTRLYGSLHDQQIQSTQKRERGYPMNRPTRIQLQRKKGWRLPPNTVSVARPHKWGNPYSVEEYGRELAIANFRRRLDGLISIGAADLSDLRGKNLACWCGPGEACHADVLLALANIEDSAEIEVRQL